MRRIRPLEICVEGVIHEHGVLVGRLSPRSSGSPS